MKETKMKEGCVKRLVFHMLWGVIALIGFARCGEAAAPCISQGVVAAFGATCAPANAPGGEAAMNAIVYNGEAAAVTKIPKITQGDDVTYGIRAKTCAPLGILAPSGIAHNGEHTSINKITRIALWGDPALYGIWIFQTPSRSAPSTSHYGETASGTQFPCIIQKGDAAFSGTSAAACVSRAMLAPSGIACDNTETSVTVEQPSKTSCLTRYQERFNQPGLQGVNAGTPKGVVVQETKLSAKLNATSDRLVAFNNWLPFAFSKT